MTIRKTCRCCAKSIALKVKMKDYIRFRRGKGHVQDCFPYLSDDERELFLSGLCGKCFDTLFGE